MSLPAFRKMNLRYPLILASKSPRRRQILADAGFQFTLKIKEVDESHPPMAPELVPTWLAEKKAWETGRELQETLVLCADTIVLLDNEILGKPSSFDEAEDMLGRLSGRSHEVITGVCVLLNDERYVFSDLSLVYFRNLHTYEIKQYVESGLADDKAGAYGVQDWLGMVAVEKIVGSYFNVMGLPIHKVYAYLSRFAM